MIGLLLVSHGELCEYMLHSTAMMTGEAKQAGAVSLKKGESPLDFENRVRHALDKLDTGEGVIVLADVLGGTPYNTVGLLSREYNLQLITGMNVPMIVQLTLGREEGSDISELVDLAHEAAKEGIKLLRQKK